LDDRTIVEYENILGKVTFRVDSPFWIEEIESGSSVDVNLREVQAVGQVGTTITSQDVQPRSFTMSGSIHDPIDENRRELLDIIVPKYRSTLTVNHNGGSWFLDVVPTKTPHITPGKAIQYFQVTLHAAYPYWRTVEMINHSLNTIIPHFMFPYTHTASPDPLMFSEYLTNYYTSVYNTGSVPIGCTIQIAARQATVTNPQITNLATSQQIKIQKTLIVRDRFIINTAFGEKYVRFSSGNGPDENGFKYLTFDSDLGFELVPGENIIHFDAESNRDYAVVNIIKPAGVTQGL
jgi:hypothetical protein